MSKSTFIVGKEKEPEAEVTVKEYSSGMKIVESGDTETFIKGKKPIAEKKLKVPESQREELRKNPKKFNVEGNRLVRKGKNK